MLSTDLKRIYFPNEEEVDRSLFLPIFRKATSCRCMTGYFTSGALRELASSISLFLKQPESEIRFLISPNLTPEDASALEKAVEAEENLVPLLFPGFDASEDSLRTKSVEALSYLVAKKRINLRVAIQAQGMFHTKAWVFDTSEGRVAVHGSGNATKHGLSSNFEQLTVDIEEGGVESNEVVEALSDRFDLIWANEYTGLRSIKLTRKTLQEMERLQKNIEIRHLTDQEIIDGLFNGISDKGGRRESLRLKIPGWLNYTQGDFAHQGEAIKAWNDHGGKGILSIATGGGKTLTSLTAASLIQSNESSLLLVISAPTKLLVNQWGEEVRQFGLEPVVGIDMPAGQIAQNINMSVRNLRSGHSATEVLILTHDALKKNRIISALAAAAKKTSMMLVGDEVHNLGSIGFQKMALDQFQYRLGLSATVERQFDKEGTQFLYEYFGPVVFDFPIDAAIGKCLVPFRYFVHEVQLDEEEKDDWIDLTAKIKKLSYAANNADGDGDKERWKLLCLKRRRIVESASQKVASLADALPKDNELVKRTLVFCTDKNPEQLNEVNNLLNARRLNFHQVTQEETGDKAKLGRIIDAFSSDILRVLTSKRVLDEGFNVPQTETAYLLAASTVRRQWVQRLGRILRKSSDTGKSSAVIHDFVVMPSQTGYGVDKDLKSLIKGEISRLQFFNGLSENGLEKNGAMDVIDDLLQFLEESA